MLAHRLYQDFLRWKASDEENPHIKKYFERREWSLKDKKFISISRLTGDDISDFEFYHEGMKQKLDDHCTKEAGFYEMKCSSSCKPITRKALHKKWKTAKCNFCGGQYEVTKRLTRKQYLDKNELLTFDGEPTVKVITPLLPTSAYSPTPAPAPAPVGGEVPSDKEIKEMEELHKKLTEAGETEIATSVRHHITNNERMSDRMKSIFLSKLPPAVFQEILRATIANNPPINDASQQSPTATCGELPPPDGCAPAPVNRSQVDSTIHVPAGCISYEEKRKQQFERLKFKENDEDEDEDEVLQDEKNKEWRARKAELMMKAEEIHTEIADLIYFLNFHTYTEPSFMGEYDAMTAKHPIIDALYPNAYPRSELNEQKMTLYEDLCRLDEAYDDYRGDILRQQDDDDSDSEVEGEREGELLLVEEIIDKIEELMKHTDKLESAEFCEITRACVETIFEEADNDDCGEPSLKRSGGDEGGGGKKQKGGGMGGTKRKRVPTATAFALDAGSGATATATATATALDAGSSAGSGGGEQNDSGSDSDDDNDL